MTKARRCAEEFAKWVAEHDLQLDLSIYVDKKRWNVDKDGNLVYDIDADARDYDEYAGNFMTVSSEGPLYNIINGYNSYDYDNRRQEEMNKIFEKYGYYYEMDYSWCFSLRKL